MEDWLAAVLAIVPTVMASAVFYMVGVRSGRKQAQSIIDETAKKTAQVIVDAINADRRIDKVDSGKVALRDSGKVGADLVVVAEKKQTVDADAVLVKEDEKAAEGEDEKQ